MSKALEPSTRGAAGKRRLLVVIENSPLGEHTVHIGTAVAASMSAEVVFHYAIPVEHVDADSAAELAAELPAHHEACKQRAKPLFESARRSAATFGLACETVLTIDEVPAEAIRRVAVENDCLLIVVGSRGRGTLARMLRGSLVDELIHLSDRPILICRADMGFGTVAPMSALA